MSTDTIQLVSSDYKINEVAFYHFSNAAIFESAGLLYQAAENYRKALKYYPDSYEIRFSLAEILYRMQHFDDALMALVSIKPEDSPAWMLRGAIFRATGQQDSAHFCYRHSVEIDSNYFSGYSYLISSFQLLGLPDSAVWAYEHLVRINPGNARIWYELGELQWDLNRPVDAEESLRKSIEINSDSTNLVAIVRLGDIHTIQHQYDSALIWYQRALELAPKDYRLWRKQGGTYRLLKRDEEAKRSYLKSLELRDDATNILTRIWLGEMYSKEDSLSKGLSIAKEAYKVAPLNPMVHRLLSNQYMHMEQFDSALTYAISEVDLTLGDVDATRHLAVLYFYTDSLTISDSIFTSLVERGDNSLVNHRFLGRIALMKDNPQRAVSEFSKVAEISISELESWLDLGFAYWKLDQGELEIKAYLSGLEHVVDEKGKLSLLFALGTAYERYGQFDHAEKTFENLLKRDPENHQAMNYLGYSLADRGKRLSYARDLIERAVTLNPNNAAYLDSYGWVYYRLEDYEKALIYLKRAVILDSDPTIFDHLGDTYQATGDSAAAKQWWEKALELDPENEVIRTKVSP